MNINDLIQQLQALQAQGVTQVFVKDATNNTNLGVVEITTDEDGDAIILAD
jgi:hypothetical protein